MNSTLNPNAINIRTSTVAATAAHCSQRCVYM